LKQVAWELRTCKNNFHWLWKYKREDKLMQYENK
jgi:hypothetical protein